MRQSSRVIIALFAMGFAACLAAGTASAVEPDERLADPALEARARAISTELRCLVCQNQSIDDSNAPLARDLRLLVRERLTAGKSDAEVITFIADRYGEFVLLRPRFGIHTALLWLSPFLLLAAVIAAILRHRRLAQPSAEPGPLTVSEQRRLDGILKDRAESG